MAVPMSAVARVVFDFLIERVVVVPQILEPLPVALVHHANQYVITDGYADREGLGSLVTGYSALLRLHEKYRIPVNLHLSGTLVEAAAWHHPAFLADVWAQVARPGVLLVGAW